VSLETDRGHHFGQVAEPKRERALYTRLCQICGDPLDREKFVAFGRAADRARGYVVEPALHPECAAYAAKACPMLSGALDHYRARPADLSMRTSPEGHRLVSAPDAAARAGRPADTYFQVWARGTDYELALADEGVVLVWPSAPLRLRTITTGAARDALNLITGR
jgi:hypothetical protein